LLEIGNKTLLDITFKGKHTRERHTKINKIIQLSEAVIDCS